MSFLDPEEEALRRKCRQQIEELRKEIVETKDKLAEYSDNPLATKSKDSTSHPTIQLKTRRCLKGHYGGVHALDWGVVPFFCLLFPLSIVF
jgi:hypothetical protein